MSAYHLSLHRDRLGTNARESLPAVNRILYILAGEVEVAAGDRSARIATAGAWHGATACTVTAGAGGATLLRYELRRGAAATTGSAASVETALVLDHPITLDPSRAYLMRGDRVDFAPGGEALPHGHKGGGIRCLVEGSLEVRAGEHPGKIMRPGDAWFESGVEPVHAIASRHEPTAFIRVSVLPREIRGQSSIVYVDPAHASVKPRKYTMFVDDPIEIA